MSDLHVILMVIADKTKSNCPRTGIKYAPKHFDSNPTTTSDPTTAPTKVPSKGPFVGRGHLDVWTANQQIGCLISHGTWFTSGACATFSVEQSESPGSFSTHSDFLPIDSLFSSQNLANQLPLDGFTLTSSKGPCSIDDDILNCGGQVKAASIFNVSKSQRIQFHRAPFQFLSPTLKILGNRW
jgi:ribonuclease T2